VAIRDRSHSVDEEDARGTPQYSCRTGYYRLVVSFFLVIVRDIFFFLLSIESLTTAGLRVGAHTAIYIFFVILLWYSFVWLLFGIR